MSNKKDSIPLSRREMIAKTGKMLAVNAALLSIAGCNNRECCEDSAPAVPREPVNAGVSGASGDLTVKPTPVVPAVPKDAVDSKPMNNDLIRIGVVGCGGRGSGAALQAISVPGSNCKLVAMGDAFENRLAKSMADIKKDIEDKIRPKDAARADEILGKIDVSNDKKFAGLDAYKKVIENCDLVILATPPGFRPVHFQAAVDAGKNVFMEKPVCVDSWGARLVMEMAKKADEKNLKVVCGLQRHYQNVYLAAYEKFKEGIIGEPRSAQIYWNGHDIWYNDRKGDMSEMKYQIYNWYHFNWLCGDHIVEQHVHNIDVANWFLGAKPISAAGMGGRTIRERNSEIFDHHAVEFRYPNGVIVNSQCRQIPGTKADVREEFQGTKGVLYPEQGIAKDFKGNVLWRYEGKHNAPYQEEHNVLHKMIFTNLSINNAHYTVDSTFAAVLGRYATYTGQEVKWDDAIKLNYRTFPEHVTWDAPTPTKPGADGKYAVPTPGKFKLA